MRSVRRRRWRHGSGAAIEAKQLGIDVLLLEKKSQTGGSFIGSEGLFAVGSHWQEEAGIDYSQDELIENCLDSHHWIANPALYKNFFKHTAGTVTWLEDLGVEFDHVQSLGDSPNAWHVYKGIGSEGTGVSFMKSFGAAAEAAGVPMELSCSGKKIVMEDGKVSGVLAVRDNGDVVKIDCKAVIVGTGGWANSAELIRELNGSDPARVTASGLDGRDGDGLKMVKDAGGAPCARCGHHGDVRPDSAADHVRHQPAGCHVARASSVGQPGWRALCARGYVPEEFRLRGQCGS